MYLRLEGAEQLRLSDGTHVQSAADHELWQAEQVAARGIARVWTAKTVVAARINHGRWVADCPVCKSADFTHPEWRIACCSGCGARFENVLFPPQVIVDLLLVRPMIENQNWEPGETASQLLAENLEHGLGVL